MTEFATEKQDTNKAKPTKKSSGFLSWLRFLIILASIFLFFKYVLGITIISGSSMVPTLTNNDVVVTSNLFYTPKRNDVVVYQNEQGDHIIKRVVALPNETIEIKDGNVIVNGEQVKEQFTTGKPSDMGQVAVEEQSYFLIGDNREPGESLDSRDDDVGPVSENKLTGKAIFSLYPPGISFEE